MNAVCTILGWCTAAAAAAGAGIADEVVMGVVVVLSALFWRSAGSAPLPWDLLLESCVGVVMSIGSPIGDAAEVLIVGVGVPVVARMGTVRAPMGSSISLPAEGLGILSVAVAIVSEG